MDLRISVVGLLALGIPVGGEWSWVEPVDSPPQHRTVSVERGAVVATVAASGTLVPTVLVQVGSQVSGQLQEVLVDLDAEVAKGQVIARLVPDAFESRVRQAQADLDAAHAQVDVQRGTHDARRSDSVRAQVGLDEARRDLQRTSILVARGYLSPVEGERADARVRVSVHEMASALAQVRLAESLVRGAKAVVRQRDAQLAVARVELERTVIRAPIDGVVIKRSVQPGQTVAASLQAPELFVIAQDLRDMRVEVPVDEAEIGSVQKGQRAAFTVSGLPGREFEGVVEQVRKAATMVQNVTTYPVIVAVAGDGRSLLPGMTADVRIVTDAREDVLKVPNAALRFDGSAAGVAVAVAAAAGAAARAAPAAKVQQIAGPGPSSVEGATYGRAYRVATGGLLLPVELTLGMSDGKWTEASSTDGAALREGDRLAVAFDGRGTTAARRRPAAGTDRGS
jgi:HlyD family secretion protein